jgi:hypothetical protein
MKIEKNKIVFISVILCIVILIGGYTMSLMGEDETHNIKNNKIPVPELADEQKEYQSKLEAINDLKEVRQTNAPSIYDERLLDSTGVYDPDLLDKEKMRMVDSIYKNGRIDYSDSNSYSTYQRFNPEVVEQTSKPKKDSIFPKIEPTIKAKELGLEHQLFFASNPERQEISKETETDGFIYVVVDGNQTVKTNYRLQMRLLRDATINGLKVLRNTPIYGFVSFKPNRALIDIENINHQPTKLKAFDYQDGSEGIYVENSFRAEAKQEVVGDVVQDINIAGVPQVGGIKTIFQRNNRTVKVTVTDNYKLILKPKL